MPSSGGNFVLDKGYDCAAQVLKFRAVKQHATVETVTPITAQGEAGLGVAQFDALTAEIAKGKGCSVRLAGITEWECNAAIARGVDVTVAADGRCEPALTGDFVWGTNVGPATTAAGQRASIALAGPGSGRISA